MITVEKLKDFGCNVEEGLQRCMNNKDFYLMLVNKSMKDEQVVELRTAIEAKDYKKGFEIAHSMKGVYGNLSITPLFIAMQEITEPLRNNNDIDYEPLLLKVEKLYAELKELSK